MDKPKIRWDEVRINAAINCMGSIIETTKHSVLETEAVKDIYTRAAVQYADAPVKQLNNSEDNHEQGTNI